MKTRLSPGHGWLGSLLLLGIGMILAGYLFARSLALLASPRPRMIDLCSLLLSASCDPALTDPRFWILGVPVAGWALVGFAMLTLLLLLARFLDDFADEALLAGSLVNLLAVMGGIATTLVAWLGPASLCSLCLLVLAVNLLLIVTLHKSTANTLRQNIRRLGAAWDWLLHSKAESPLVRWKLLGLGSVALIGIVCYQWMYVEATLRRPLAASEPTPAQALAAYRATPRLEFPVDEGDPHLGPLDAPVQIVVFASFQCPACRNVLPTLSRVQQRFGDRLLVVFKHYPLSAQCNPRLTVDQQPGACEAAWAAEAAHRQGEFWPFCAALFATEAGVDESLIARAVQDLDLDADRFSADRRLDATVDRVAADIQLGSRLKIPGTPAVFLDGRLLRRADETTLELLMQEELASALESMRTERAMRVPSVVGDSRRSP